MNDLKIAREILLGLCVLALTGCGAGNIVDKSTTENTNSSESPVITENNEQSGDTASNDANNLIDSSTMQGSVISFSDIGCSVSQAISEDDGQSAKVAAPGSENADTTVNIQYQTNCVFQTAIINRTTEIATISDASISDIKKQTSLIIYGDFEGTHDLTATKVIIARYE